MRRTYFTCQQLWTLGAVLANNAPDTIVCLVVSIAFFILFYREKP